MSCLFNLLNKSLNTKKSHLYTRKYKYFPENYFKKLFGIERSDFLSKKHPDTKRIWVKWRITIIEKSYYHF